MNEKKLLYVVICILIIAVIVSFVQIDDLRADIASLRNSLSNSEHRLEQKISSIHDNVDEQMKKQASLFSSVSHSLGSFDKESMLAELEISVVPKVVVDGMSVKVSVGENTAEMIKTGNGEYSASLPVGIFEEYDTHPIAVIRVGNEMKTEYLETVAVSYLWTNYLPTVEMAEIWNDSVTYKEEYEPSETTLTVDGYIELSCAKESPEARFEKIYVTAETEDGEIARKDITSRVQNSEGGESVALSVPFRETYKIGESEELYFYVVAEDSLGYIHKVQAFVWTRPDDGETARQPHTAPEWAGARDHGERIYDTAGKLLLGDEF